MMDLFESAPTFDDPIGMLWACHRRIERALTVMERIAGAEQAGVLDGPSREALRQTLHYFQTGVPRHARDEEESLFPRLRAALGQDTPSARALLDSLEQEHTTADAAQRDLELLGERLLHSGRFETAGERARFSELIGRLQQLYHEHIRREDDELFPLAALVVEDKAREAIGSEMASRRGIDWERQRQVVAQLGSRPWIRRPTKKA